MQNHAHFQHKLARQEALLTIGATAITVMFAVLLVHQLVPLAQHEWQQSNLWPRVRFILFVSVLLALGYGVAVFLLCRIGYYTRLSNSGEELSPPRIDLGQWRDLAPMTVLVPSFREDGITIWQTLVSAALQDYPETHVVLLIDDPANPSTPQDRRLLTSARNAPSAIRQYLEAPRSAVVSSRAEFRQSATRSFDLKREVERVREAYYAVGTWLLDEGGKCTTGDHTTRHFGEFVLTRHGHDLIDAAEEIPALIDEAPDHIARIEELYARLEDQVSVTISSFERKRFANLGSAANKAANLNAYIGLMGTRRREVNQGGDTLLVTDDGTNRGPVWDVRNPDFVVTLDADSIVAGTYARHLVGKAEQSGNEQMAVVQTPYSSIPGAPTAIERAAGATTDIQYIVHQGFTWLNATFWVGANAVLRKRALDSIRTDQEEDGYAIPTFIQDRTVIEDTESTIDLVAEGWLLHNEPQRLAYSATPPDFGSLVIQRRRWANGGLLILPKLVRLGLRRGDNRFGWIELFVRAHYLVSPALSSLGMLSLIFLPLSKEYASPWLAVAGLPYLALYWRDLVKSGYSHKEYARVFALNWLLVPINLAGVLKSIQQGVTGAKIPFGRTPKVTGRTTAPAWTIAAVVVITAYVALSVGWNAHQHRWLVLGFDLLTLVSLVYGGLVLVGWRAMVEDLAPWFGFVRRFTSRQTPESGTNNVPRPNA